MKYVCFLSEVDHQYFEMTKFEINLAISEGCTQFCDQIISQIDNKFVKALLLLNLAKIFRKRNL